jgi:DNA-binding transcriptional MocR family regulator
MNWYGPHSRGSISLVNEPVHSQSATNGLNKQSNEELADVLRGLANWTTGGGPLYQRLSDALRAAIVRGDLPAGMRLPPERLLAERLLVSRSTVVAAYDHLRQADFLERRQGSGTRVRYAPPEVRPTDPALGLSRSLGRNTLFGRIMEGPDETIDLAGGFLLSPGGLPASTLVGLERELAGLSRHGSGYAPLGYPPLRQAIADHLSSQGLPTIPEEVLVTSGAQQAIYLTACLHVQHGDTVVVENPTYPGALDAFVTAGARLAWITTGRHGADVEAIAELAAHLRPRLTYLIPTHQNPTGGVMGDHQRRRLARIVEEHQLTVIDDESLWALGLGDGDPPRPIATFAPGAPILTIGSLSKLGWGGLRAGWVRASDQVIVRLGRLKAVADLGGSIPGQVMATRLLESFDEIRLDRRRLLAERFELVSALLGRLLPTWEWERPLGGLCLWVRLPHGSAAEFAQIALRHGVSVVAGSVASADGSFGDFLRLPYGQEPRVLEEGIQRLANAWNAYMALQAPRHQTFSVIV